MALRSSPICVVTQSQFAGSRQVSIYKADWNEDGFGA
jgi:hypothetical protein